VLLKRILLLVGPPLILAGGVVVVGALLGKAAAAELVGLIGATFFALGKLVILTPAHHPAFTATFLAGLVVTMDVLTAVVFVFNLDWLYRIPSIGAKLEALQAEGEFIVSQNRWMRRVTIVAVVAFVMFPLTMTGSVGASVFGRLLGLSKARTMLGIVGGSVLGCGLMVVFAQALRPLFDAVPSGYRTVLGLAFAAALVAALNWRYQQLRNRS